jgi:hypothetical protein
MLVPAKPVRSFVEQARTRNTSRAVFAASINVAALCEPVRVAERSTRHFASHQSMHALYQSLSRGQGTKGRILGSVSHGRGGGHRVDIAFCSPRSESAERDERGVRGLVADPHGVLCGQTSAVPGAARKIARGALTIEVFPSLTQRKVVLGMRRDEGPTGDPSVAKRLETPKRPPASRRNKDADASSFVVPDARRAAEHEAGKHYRPVPQTRVINGPARRDRLTHERSDHQPRLH